MDSFGNYVWLPYTGSTVILTTPAGSTGTGSDVFLTTRNFPYRVTHLVAGHPRICNLNTMRPLGLVHDTQDVSCHWGLDTYGLLNVIEQSIPPLFSTQIHY